MKPQYLAKGRLRSGEKNKTEQDYENRLKLLQHSGLILWYKFEAINLRLADKTFYKPDFLVIAQDGVLECHEVKSWWTDDARVKIKVAASQFPFRFKAAMPKKKKDGGGWEVEIF